LRVKLFCQPKLSVQQKKHSHFDYTYYIYLAQQASGLTDEVQQKRQSNRTRNWFAVDWNLYITFKSINLVTILIFATTFGLDASRKA
jgi:Fe(3+) dicitrate transport protein